MKIAVVGSACWDLYIESERLPLEGETLSATGGGNIRPGGKGSNTAVACARSGAQTAWIGQLGQDMNGDMLAKTMADSGVDISHINRLEGTPTGQATVILLASTENAIIIIGGTNMAWTELSEQQRAVVAESDVLLLQREIPESVNIDAAKAAKNAGKMVVMDVGGRDDPLSDELLSLIDILSPNETELARISGISDFEESVQHVLAKGVKHLLIKLGSNGSMYVGSEGRHSQGVRCKEGMKIVDTTGAGDCFTGSFVVRLMEQGPMTLDSIKEAMDYAARSAFLTITVKGAMEGIPTREAVDNF